MFSKNIVLVTDNSLLMNSVKENWEFDTESLYIFPSDPIPSKIDLLILDSNNFQSTEPHRVKTIINISNNEYFSGHFYSNEIKIPKPFKLNKLLQLTENALQSQDLFCSINADYIYNERLQILASGKELIKLTEKENQIFKAILGSSNFEITKESLLKNIWRYHEDSESLTVDTHLYKLKTKLPGGMLDVKNNVCKLVVDK